MWRTAVAALAGTLLTCAAAPLATAQPPGYSEYVSLGDSWSAGATLNPALLNSEFVPLGCLQRTQNFARQVAEALNVPTFRDAACAGATTEDMTADQPLGKDQYPSYNTPQFDRLTPNTDLVTILIGGNNVGLAATVRTCITPNPAISPCVSRFVVNGVDQMTQRIEAAEPTIAATIDGIKARSPRARIVMLNYLDGVAVGDPCYPIIPISPTDVNWLAEKLSELNTMLAAVARQTGVEFANTYAGSVGHDACRAPGVRWVEGLIPVTAEPPGPALPFHPNQLGVNHQASTVLATLGG